MARLREEKPSLTSAGYITNRAMLDNLVGMIRARLEPSLEAVGNKAAVLDVGCGHSPYKNLLKRWNLVGINLDAIDASPSILADAQRLPFRKESFDAALCTQVIEHVPDPARMLREIAHCLKPNGLLLLSGPMHWPLHEEPYDFWRFTRHGMKHLLQQQGFDLLELHDDGHAIALAVQATNHLFPGRFLAPIRIVLNLLGYWADKLWVIRHSTPNLSLIARKRPA
jgi:SAM-dependent methyltransferase